MWTVFRWLGMAAGALSLVMLVKQGFGWGFIAPLQTILDYYHAWVTFLLGWAEPFVRDAVRWLGELVGFKLHLNPEWKHLLVAVVATLSGITGYFVRRAIRGEDFQREGSALAGSIVIVALVFGISGALVPEGDGSAVGAGLGTLAVLTAALCLSGSIGDIEVDILPFVLYVTATAAMPISGLLMFGVPGAVLGIGAAVVSYWILIFGIGGLDRQGFGVGMVFTAAPLGAAAFIITNAGLKLAGL